MFLKQLFLADNLISLSISPAFGADKKIILQVSLADRYI
jgi:hypothetical protein